MFITVQSLATAINEKRYVKQEEILYTYEILILDDYNNIIYHYYKTTDNNTIETIAKNTCKLHKEQDKTNYYYKILKLK